MKSKLVALGILVVVFLVPFRMAYLSDEIANSGRFILGFFTTIVGFLIAFGIGTNEPFDKKKKSEGMRVEQKEEIRKAA